jgi:hypothetical protein
MTAYAQETVIRPGPQSWPCEHRVGQRQTPKDHPRSPGRGDPIRDARKRPPPNVTTERRRRVSIHAARRLSDGPRTPKSHGRSC